MSFFLIIWISLFPFNNEPPIDNSALYITKEKSQLSTAVLYVFTGSDWCADCRRLKKNVLSDSVFIASMERNKIKIEIIDFPQRIKLSPEVVKHNEAVAETFGFQGIFFG